MKFPLFICKISKLYINAYEIEASCTAQCMHALQPYALVGIAALIDDGGVVL